MSNVKEVFVTNEGLQELKKELEYLKFEKRPQVIEALKDAKALGDLSENAEYDAARNEQAITEGRITELEVLIENAVIVTKKSTDTVGLGVDVTIKYEDDEDEEVYSIVGSTEADPFLNKISNESPIAIAIMGKKIGEEAVVDSPAGSYKVKIVNIA